MKRYIVYITISFLLLSACSAAVFAEESGTDVEVIQEAAATFALVRSSEAGSDDPPEDESENEPDEKSDEYSVLSLSDLEEVTSIYNVTSYIQALTLECDTSPESAAKLEEFKDDLSQTFQYVIGLTDDEDCDEVPLVPESIDYGGLDISIPGTYIVTVRLKLDDTDEYTEGFTISDETRTLSLQVTVYDPEKLTLTYSKTLNTYIQYLVSPSGDENPVLRYAVTEPDTEPTESDWTSEIPDGFCTYSQNGVRIYRSMLDPEKYYYLKVCRDDLTSNVVKLIPPTSTVTGDGMGGDRDGSDTNDTTLDKPLIQTPPSGSGNSSSEGKSDSSSGQPPQVDASAPQTSQNVASAPQSETETTTVSERFDNSTLTISGSRLRMMLASDTEIIPFGWNGISLEMPASFIETLAPSDTDMFSLTLTHEDKLAFSVLLTVSGTEIKELPSSLIRIPADPPEGGYSLLRSGETLPTDVSYENNCAVFTITRTGRYMLKDVPEVPVDRETPNLQEETTSSKNESDGHTTSSGTDKTPKTQDVTGAISSADTGSIIAPATSDEASASTWPETESSPALSAGKENTPPAPTLPEALPAATAGTVSFSAGIYWLWRKHR